MESLKLLVLTSEPTQRPLIGFAGVVRRTLIGHKLHVNGNVLSYILASIRYSRNFFPARMIKWMLMREGQLLEAGDISRRLKDSAIIDYSVIDSILFDRICGFIFY